MNKKLQFKAKNVDIYIGQDIRGSGDQEIREKQNG